MTNSDKKQTVKLPQTFVGRSALAVVCAVLFSFSAFMCFGLMFNVQAVGGVVDQMFLVVIRSLAFALLMFSLLGLVWSLARPKWVEGLIQVAIGRLAMALFVFCVFSLPVVFWTLLVLRPQGR